MHILINKKYLTFNKYKAKCAIGKRGIGNKKKEGDLITPKGIYKVRYILYRKDRVKKIKTQFILPRSPINFSLILICKVVSFKKFISDCLHLSASFEKQLIDFKFFMSL